MERKKNERSNGQIGLENPLPLAYMERRKNEKTNEQRSQ